jgi:UDP-galactose transporter B1
MVSRRNSATNIAVETSVFFLYCRRFTFLKALNGVQSIACFFWAAALLTLPTFRKPKGVEFAPWYTYWKPGISNSIGPALGSEALKNITYPAQV